MGVFLQSNSKTTGQRGFTLVEVAIGLIIIGLLMVPYMQLYTAQRQKEVFNQAIDNAAVIDTALRKFVYQNGRYPKPANRSLAAGSAGFGEEVTTTITPCSLSNITICRATVPSAVAPNNTVLIGSVPLTALELPLKYAVDGYNNQFTYAVTESQTVAGTFNNTAGIITIRDRNDSTSSSVDVGTTYHYIVLSHGPDRKGAFTLAGVQTSPCTALGRDVENCNNDAIFTNNLAVDSAGFWNRQESTPAGNSHYDDVTKASKDSASGGLWDTVAPQPSIYSNLGSANIRIGGSGDPQARLHIMDGNLNAVSLQARRICDSAEVNGCTPAGTNTSLAAPRNYTPNVFDPNIIAGPINTANANTDGGGIYCGSSTPMTGLSNADEECNFAGTGLPRITGCGANMIAVGVNPTTRALICVIP